MLSQIPPPAKSAIDLSHFASRIEPVAPYIPWADRPKLTWAEQLEVNAVRNGALYDAEHDPGTDHCGLTASEVGAWVRRAEAEAIAAVHASRELVEADGPRPTADDSIEISPEAAAEWEGFSIGVEGVPAVGPATYSPTELEAWKRGHAAGLDDYMEREVYSDPEYREWSDAYHKAEFEAMINDPDFGPESFADAARERYTASEPSFYELAELNGSDFARSIGGAR